MKEDGYAEIRLKVPAASSEEAYEVFWEAYNTVLNQLAANEASLNKAGVEALALFNDIQFQQLKDLSTSLVSLPATVSSVKD